MTVHAGSYHLALHDAGIEMANIMMYRSIRPKSAVLKEYPGRAGIIYGLLHDENGEKQDGLVCEFGGGMSEADVRTHLRDMLDELYFNGYEHFELSEIRYIVETIVSSKADGPALVALCFMNYIYPEVAED